MPDIVSVIIPTYNSAKYIEETLHSACEQTYHSLEIIVVDDCSTDETASLVKALKDPRVRLIRQDENGGAGVARNAGVAVASGRFIAFLDSDDIWFPTKIEKQIAFMKENAVTSCYTLYALIDDGGANFGDCGEISKTLTYKQLLPHNPIRTSSFVYDAEALGKIYFPLIRKRQDFGLFLESTKRAGQSRLFSEVTNAYRVRADSISGNKFKNIPFQWNFYRECLNMGKLISTRYLSEWLLRAGMVEIRRHALKARK
jgi:glycosyltransferase involved in cell wall biosynthesis